jgi:PAS domain S-box-containing protein
MAYDKVHNGDPATRSDAVPPATFPLLVIAGGGAAALLGCIALAGWLLLLPRLASLGQGLIPMAPSTAILFVGYGCVLMMVRSAAGNRRLKLFCQSVLAVGALISVVLFFLSCNKVYLDIEHLGIHAMGAADGTPIGHMSPITAVSFLLISLLSQALITTRPDSAWRAKTAWWLAIVLLAAYCMLILAYLFGTPMFYSGTFIPPAATTSLAFLALGAALMALAHPLAWPETDSHDLGERFFSSALIVVFIFLVAGIISAGYFYHRKHEKQYLFEIERQLSTIAGLKMGELLLWREERLADAGLFHNNSAFEDLVKDVIEHPEAAHAHREANAWISRLQSKRNYNGIFLLDTQGKSRVAIPEKSAVPLSRYVHDKALESLRTRQVSFADFHRNEFNGKIYLGILVPIFDSAHSGEPLGVLVIRIDPEKYLYPFIQSWPTNSATAETLLVRKEGNTALFLNELKFKKNAALNFSIPLEKTEIPSVMAALGREGVVRGIDYRGHSVIAALRGIPDSPWHLVTRVDVDEVYAPMRERLWITVLLVSAMLVSAGTGVGFVWRRQSSRFYRDRYEAELKRVELEERLVKIAANLPGAIVLYQLFPDGSSCFPYASNGLEQLYGVRPEEVARKTSPLLAMVHPDDAAQVSASIRESARTLSAWHNEHRVINPDRGVIWVEGNATPELRQDGSALLYGFLTEITGRKEKEREIEIKNSELERFTYTVSHDLKSPLVTIKTFLGYLEEDLEIPDKPRVQQDLGFMHNAADKMTQLLDELLELSRVGRLNNAPQEVAFGDLAREAVELDAGRISARGVDVEICDSPVVLWGDRPRLVEIWQNLVENACKFMGNQESPRIEIGVDVSGQEALFFVRDNGMGIDPRFQSKIFGLFEKLEAGVDGTGMGLALVKRIVELYDGTIRVESAGKGEGTTFFFTLPGAIKKY